MQRFLFLRAKLAENSLNKNVDGICGAYRPARNFEDIKQTVVVTLIDLLPKYDLSVGVTFLSFTKRYVKSAVQRHIRLYRSCYAVENDNHYRELRKVNGIYYDFKNLEKPPVERFEDTVRKTGKSGMM